LRGRDCGTARAELSHTLQVILHPPFTLKEFPRFQTFLETPQTPFIPHHKSSITLSFLGMFHASFTIKGFPSISRTLLISFSPSKFEIKIEGIVTCLPVLWGRLG